MIYYITTHSKNVHCAKKIKQMFLEKNCEYYFVYGLGSTEKVEPYIDIPSEETYANLPLKTYHILEHFLKTNHTYMFKMDDDTFVDVEYFNNQPFTEDYIGMFFDYPQDTRSSIFHWYKVGDSNYKIPKRTFKLRYAEGGGYILSKKAAQKCYEAGYDFFINTPETYLGEDTKVGMCLDSEDIIKLNLMRNAGMNYEITQNLDIIHPVHFLLFDKLIAAKTVEEKKSVLLKYNYLNANAQRDAFLTETLKTFNPPS